MAMKKLVMVGVALVVFSIGGVAQVDGGYHGTQLSQWYCNPPSCFAGAFASPGAAASTSMEAIGVCGNGDSVTPSSAVVCAGCASWVGLSASANQASETHTDDFGQLYQVDHLV